jgi:predicted negative regulator of RcsB-dependent stress response
MAEEYLTDDEQLDEVKRLVKEYGPVLVIGALLGVGGFFGFRYYRSYQDDQGLKAAGRFSQMTLSLQTSDNAKAREIAAGLIKDFPNSPYADQAQLALARVAVDEGHDDQAVGPLTGVMNGSKDSELKHIARLRLARVLIDQGKPEDAIKLLGEGTPGTFAARYHEVRADALIAKKDVPAAVTEYKAALSAAEDGGVDSALIEMRLADLGVTENNAAKTNKVTP